MIWKRKENKEKQMKTLEKVRKLICDSTYRLEVLCKYKILKLNDEEFLKRKYKLIFHKELNLEKPSTYNEKLQWLKLNYRNDLLTKLVDKYNVRAYVKDFSNVKLIPLIAGPYHSFDEINFEDLPNSFVLKCTHDSGGLVICKDKSKLDLEEARVKLEKSLNTNYYETNREWAYKNVPPAIIVEKLMVDESGSELKDYKFFCFDGKPRVMFVAKDRATDTKFDFYDMDYNHLDIKNGHENSEIITPKPDKFEEMKESASKLSKDFPHVRVDLYNINGEIYFGEMTFYHWSGFVPFDPEKWDTIFGNWLKLPKKL